MRVEDKGCVLDRAVYTGFEIGGTRPWRQGIDRTPSLLISARKKQLAYWYEKVVPSPTSALH